MVCLHAFRCAMVRYMYSLDRRYVETLRDSEYRKIMRGHWKHEMRVFRAQRARDKSLRQHIVR